MASFGWSAGDVIAVATLAWKLYKACRSTKIALKQSTTVHTANPHLQAKALGMNTSHSLQKVSYIQ